jgi:hypothetical protein
MIRGKENCTLTVKVSRAHLTRDAREEITSRRALWGTEVYSDDSDVVAACIHGGWIRGEWPEESIDVSLLDLDQGPNSAAAADLRNTAAKGNKRTSAASTDANQQQQQQQQHLLVLDSPPATGPMHVPPNRDLHVTLLVLPRLERYASMARYGMQSREWGAAHGDAAAGQPPLGSRHDGLSFKVMALRWVANGSQPQDRVRGKARRDRINKALREIESGGPAWVVNGKAPAPPGQQHVVGIVGGGGLGERGKEREASRDGSAAVAVQAGGGTGWWKPVHKAGSEGDKENRPAVESIEIEPVQDSAAGPEVVMELEPEPEPEPARERERLPVEPAPGGVEKVKEGEGEKVEEVASAGQGGDKQGSGTEEKQASPVSAVNSSVPALAAEPTVAATAEA